MQELGSISGIIVNLCLLTITFITMIIIEFTHKYDSTAKLVLMPLDKNRNKIISMFFILSGIFFIFLIVSILSGNWIAALYHLVNFIIWIWFPLLSMKETNSTKVGIVTSERTEKPSRKTTEGLTFILAGFYRTTLSDKKDEHGHETVEEELSEIAEKVECTIDQLISKDGESFKVKAIFWIKLDLDRSTEIRNYKGGLKGLKEEVCNQFDTVCKVFDSKYDVEEIFQSTQNLDEDHGEKFYKDVTTELRKHVGTLEQNEPITITEKTIIILPIPSEKYQETIRKKFQAKKDAEAIKQTAMSQIEIVLEMVTKTGRDYESCLDELQRNQNQAGTKYRFDGTATSSIQPTLPIK